MTDFQRTLASRFSSIGDVASVARTASPLASLGLSRDFTSIVGTHAPIDIGGLVHTGPATVAQPPTALTPIDAGTFIGRIARSPQQAVTAALHAARAGFEAIPVAENGDVIDAAIPNGFRAAMISLLSLVEAAVQQLDLRPPQPTGPPPPVTGTPPVHVPPTGHVPPPVHTPPVDVGPIDRPPIVVDPGFIRFDPSFVDTVVGRPGVVDPAPDAAVSQPGGDVAAGGGLPMLDFGGRVFEPTSVTHPETGDTTTVFVERPAGTAEGTSVASLDPVSGGGFHLMLDTAALGGVSGATGLTGTEGVTGVTGVTGITSGPTSGFIR